MKTRIRSNQSLTVNIWLLWTCRIIKQSNIVGFAWIHILNKTQSWSFVHAKVKLSLLGTMSKVHWACISKWYSSQNQDILKDRSNSFPWMRKKPIYCWWCGSTLKYSFKRKCWLRRGDELMAILVIFQMILMLIDYSGWSAVEWPQLHNQSHTQEICLVDKFNPFVNVCHQWETPVHNCIISLTRKRFA